MQCLSEFDKIFLFYNDTAPTAWCYPSIRAFFPIVLLTVTVIDIQYSEQYKQPPSIAQQIKIFSTPPSCGGQKVNKQIFLEKLTMPRVKCQSEFMSPARGRMWVFEWVIDLDVGNKLLGNNRKLCGQFSLLLLLLELQFVILDNFDQDAFSYIF